MAITAVIWPVGEQEEERATYKVQVSNVPKRSKSKLLREMKEWRQAGDGVNFKNGKLIFLFKRDFKNQREMLDWVSTVPYPVHRLNRNGVEVEIKKKKVKNGPAKRPRK